jgi:hypothetical protein
MINYCGRSYPWSSMAFFGSATVIPIYALQGTQECGNGADQSTGLTLDIASPWLARETGGFSLHGEAPAHDGRKPSIVGYALRTLYSFAGFIQ